MDDKNICAVIVSFHPSDQLLENISLLLPQVQGLVVVDNGSRDEEISSLRAASGKQPFAFLEAGRNLGIGAALNIGVRWAIENGFSWVVLFDQDSTVTEGLVAALWDACQSHPATTKVALACPMYVNRSTGIALSAGPTLKDGGVMVAMTSGSLLPLWTFQQCGFFNEDLFIDQVDFEYCLRLRKCGFIAIQSKKAALLHTPGTPRPLFLFGIRLVTPSYHNAKRRYYMTRNTIWVIQQYRKEFPSWCRDNAIALLRDTVKTILVEGDRWNKAKYIWIGLKHGLKKKLGYTIQL
jgi:rhamnosyltransferase